MNRPWLFRVGFVQFYFICVIAAYFIQILDHEQSELDSDFHSSR